MTETEIQKRIITIGKATGAKVYRMNSGSVRVRGGYAHLCEEGTPDLLFLWPRAVMLWCEVKKPGEEPTDIQRQRHRELRNMGYSVAVCHSEDEFREALDEIFHIS